MKKLLHRLTGSRKDRGKEGEELACRYLRRRGFAIEARNYRCRYGEVDIVARRGKTLVFVEVKSRGRTDYGFPQEAVDGRKQKRLRLVAQHFIQQQLRLSGDDCFFRFDVIAVVFRGEDEVQIDHIENAF